MATVSSHYIISLIFLGTVFGSGVKQQTFRKVPQDVEVIEGHAIYLPCRVDYQRGQAQWTQNGFALGFNRTIPGFPRYSMIGNAQNGVHDLQILNSTLVDDGEFQCQVTPMLPSQGIRHAARITVILPPTSVELSLQSEEDGKFTVRSGETFRLTCVAKNAKPVPTIEWFRGSERLRLENQNDEVEAGNEESRLSLRSTITLSATFADNDVIYGCRALHPATTSTDSQLSDTVRLNVQYEPGLPLISGYADGQIIKAGENKTLSCRSRGGNPLPEVVWYKNDQQIDTTFNKHHNYTVNDYRLNITAADNNAIYECQVYNLMTQKPKKSTFHMRVNFSPSAVTISGPDEVSVGDVISISCEATNSNPPADVSLVINGVSPVGIATRQIKTNDGGFTTFSNLTGYQVAPMQSDLAVNCYAVNQPLGDTKLSSKVITVLRSPSRPIIFGYEPGTILRKGNRRRLTCQSQGGNPLPDLKWFKGSIEQKTETIKDKITSTSYLNVLLDQSDNGAEYRCEASNSATSSPLVNSTVLIVTYPPSRVKIDISPQIPLEGEMVTFLCTTSAAFPKANISWWKDGFQLVGAYGPETDGLYLGTIRTYSINVTATRELNNKRFTCNADNGFKSTTHDVITLQVHFSPEIISMDETIQIKEGENISLTPVIEANPTSIICTWRFANNIVMSGNSLNIFNASKAVAGVYTLEATNSIGSTYRNVTILIQFAPIITAVIHQKGGQQGSRMSLECYFEGSPIPTVEWTREYYDFAKTETTTFSNKSLLTFLNATSEDTGFFTCVAKNEIQSTTSKNISLIIDQPPVADPNPKYLKAAADLGGTGRLVCRVNAFPMPEFMWYTKGREPISSDVHTRYEVLPYQLVDELYTYESVLLVKEVSPKDHGSFTCQIRNSHGMINIPIHLEGTTKPDPPQGLRVINITHNAAELGWEPGFDGGLQQSFRIRYNTPEIQSFLYIDVYPKNATQFLLSGLVVGTSYKITVGARNSKGESNQSVGVIVNTLSEAPIGSLSPGIGPGKTRMPGLVIVIITLVGVALLVLNVALITCFIKKKTDKKRFKASSDKRSSKSTTIEMYAPSSYTGTVTGETLSSISEKSRESYAQEDSVEDYDMDASRVPAKTTYLIEQLDPPPQYASHSPHMLSHSNMNTDDQYGENMRRNQYNTAIGYGTLGRNVNPTLGQDHYNISNADSYPRYNYVPPSNNSMHSTIHNHYNGSLRRNAQSKLHFPKDYIRNGSMGNNSSSCSSPTKGIDTSFVGGMPSQSRINNPTLSTFTPDVAANTIRIEHRGHLV